MKKHAPSNIEVAFVQSGWIVKWDAVVNAKSQAAKLFGDKRNSEAKAVAFAKKLEAINDQV